MAADADDSQANALVRQVRRAAGLSRNAKLYLAMSAINGLGNGIFLWVRGQ